MRYELATVVFDNDFYFFPLPTGELVVLNKINESLQEGKETVEIKKINIVVTTEETSKMCSSVIGVGNNYFTLTSAYTEYQGLILTDELMQYCYLDIPETE